LRNLTEIEARIPHLPVPSSTSAKARLLKQVREAPLVPPSLRVVAPALPLTPPKERGLRKAAVAVALAAAVVMFAIGLSLWPRHPPAGQTGSPPERATVDPKKWREALRDERVARAPTPQQKVEVLVAFADELLHEARNPDALPPAEQLEVLASVYEDTVRKELMRHAQAIFPAEQRAFLPRIASELGRTESEFSRIAASAPADTAKHLRRIASIAHEGDLQLREIARKASA
jgi:hypothetical protein